MTQLDNIIFMLLLGILLYLYISIKKLKTTNREKFTDTQAIQNIAEMYNTDKLTSTKLNITGSFNMLPRGVIIAWDGNNAIPDGWVRCTGHHGTPNLRNKFIYCANEGSESGQTGGSSTTTLHKNNLPQHGHSLKVWGNGHGGKNNSPNWGNGVMVTDNVGLHVGLKGGSDARDMTHSPINQPFDNMPPYYKLIYIMKT